MLIKPNNKFFHYNYDYFKPNTKLNEDFTFLDFEIKTNQKNEIYRILVNCKNLLNNTFFSNRKYRFSKHNLSKQFNAKIFFINPKILNCNIFINFSLLII